MANAPLQIKTMLNVIVPMATLVPRPIVSLSVCVTVIAPLIMHVSTTNALILALLVCVEKTLSAKLSTTDLFVHAL